MYKKAHEIVGALYSFGPNEKKKRCEFDDVNVDVAQEVGSDKSDEVSMHPEESERASEGYEEGAEEDVDGEYVKEEEHEGEGEQ